jgi:acetyl-CoA carboxylase biotin carboxylase subunit
MVAKIICWGRDRSEAIARMRRALQETVVDGIETTISFHLRVLADEAFVKGEIHTGYLEAFLASGRAAA